MRIGVFHTAFEAVGGAELLAATQTRMLAEAGLDLGVVTFGWSESPWGGLFGEVPIQEVPRRSWKDWMASDRSSKWVPRVARALPYLRDFDAVVAHCQPLAALLGEADLPVRRLWYCHEAPWRLHPDRVDYALLKPLPAEPWLAPLRDMAAGIRRWSAKEGARREQELKGTARLDGVAANSAFAQRALASIYGRSDIRVIPPAVRFPAQVAHRQGLGRDGLRILVQGRLELPKNIETLVRGFAAYRAKAGAGARLHVVGDGSDRKRLEALASDLGLAEVVRFHGAVDPIRGSGQLEAICQSCDVFALMPLDESFGLVYPEAAARGLLLVGPDQGGPVEILEGGRLGACVPTFSPEAFAEALRGLEALSDAEADRRRIEADRACRARYSAGAVLPLLRAWIEDRPLPV